MRASVLGLGAVAAVVGCGAHNGESVKSAVKSYVTAVAHDDGAKACDELTAAAQRRVVRILSWTGSSNCAGALRVAYSHLPDSLRQRARNARVVDVHVRGGTATARLAGGGRSAELVQVNGRWLISGGLLPTNA